MSTITNRTTEVASDIFEDIIARLIIETIKATEQKVSNSENTTDQEQSIRQDMPILTGIAQSSGHSDAKKRGDKNPSKWESIMSWQMLCIPLIRVVRKYYLPLRLILLSFPFFKLKDERARLPRSSSIVDLHNEIVSS